MTTDATHPSASIQAQPVAIITGASQGIGRAIAHQLAGLGMHLVLCARNTQALSDLVSEIQADQLDIKVLMTPCDVRDAQQVQAVVDKTKQHFGRIDVLINNAGVAAKVGLLQETSLEDIDRTIDTNLKGAIYGMRAVIPMMVQQQSGTIININSIAGKTAYPYWSVYDASKFGLRAVTEAVAEEQRTNNIKVVGLYPGAVDTAIWDQTHIESDLKKGGMLDADNIADAVVYILEQPPKVFITELVINTTQPVV